MQFPAPQAVSSTTFRPPPLDGSLSIPQIYDYHLTHTTKHPLFVYKTVAGQVKTILWPEAVRAFHRAARLVQAYVQAAGIEVDHVSPPVFAILASTDSFTYFALMAGIIRAGCVAFPISTRNSDIGIAHLLKKTCAGFMFVSKDHAMKKLGATALDCLMADGSPSVEILPMPTFESLYTDGTELFEPLPPMERPKDNAPALILHSSGSTAFPKPIILTHRIMLQWGRLPYFGETDLCDQILSCHSLPMFHAMGAIQLVWTAATGLAMSAFAPRDQPIVPTPDGVFTDAVATGSTFIFCVPAFIEHWSRDPERIEALKRFKTVIFAGAPMTKAVGDMLVEQGVSLVPFYGATEFGCVTTFLPKGPTKDGWEYFSISRHLNPTFLPQDDKDDVFELVLVDCESHTPCFINSEVDGKPAYASSDLLVRHPTNPNLWKVYGRTDDQIMHTTGEKTNPGPLEAMLCRNPKVGNAVMFGRGKFHAGIIVDPVPKEKFDPNDLKRLAAFRNEIWQTVENVNAYAPTHSRLFKEMIIVSHPLKPFELTPKGTPRRHVVIAAYEQEIEKAYADVEESSQAELSIPATWGPEKSLQFSRNAVDRVLKETVDDDDDIFQNGCDSLQATWIRNTVLRALRSSKIPTRDMPHNFVYQYPTIRSLANFITSTACYSSSGKTNGDARSLSLSEMEHMVAKYSSDFPQHRPSAPAPESETILLTGTTGGFGSYILANLLAQPSVSRVYALNRKDSKNGQYIVARQKAVFEQRGLDPTLINNKKLVLLEGETSLPSLGLGQVDYDEIRDSVTCIIHNAWRVDFNVSLASMEPMISGTRHLIDLALSSPHPSPPRFLFTSSISVYRNWTEGIAPEEWIPKPETAQGLGYGESKWVAEHIIARCAEKTPLSATVIRVGQLSGGPNGSWNTAEWVPSLVRSAQFVDCLPSAPGHISWIPSHVAAAVLVEMRNCNVPVVHLAHPGPVPWSTVFERLAAKLKVPLIPYSEWLTKLEVLTHKDSEAAVTAAVENPVLRLLDFFRTTGEAPAQDDNEAMGFPRLSTDAAIKAAPSLASVPALGTKDVEQWLSYWSRIGFLRA